MKNTCKLIVDKGIAYLTMPDGTIIPEQRDLVVKDPFTEQFMNKPMEARVSMLIEVEVTVFAQWMDTIEKGKRVPRLPDASVEFVEAKVVEP